MKLLTRIMFVVFLLGGFQNLNASDSLHVVTSHGTYSYALDEIQVDMLDIKDLTSKPEIVKLFQLISNYPNPFNPATTIKYSLSLQQDIKINIYNVLGQKVRNLYSGVQDAGNHRLFWDGKDDCGTQVTSGVYFYQLTNGAELQTRKMILIK